MKADNNIRISGKILLLAAVIYIYIPIAIFIFGWTNFISAFLCGVVVVYSVDRFIKSASEKNPVSDLYINRVTLITVVIFIAFMSYMVGWGRFVTQTADWMKHNGVLSDLVNKSWPVYYRNEYMGQEEKSMLVYYIGQYMVPAYIGKLFSNYRLAEIVSYIWNMLGMLIIYLNLIRVLKIVKPFIQGIAAFFLFYFSMPLLLAQKLLEFFKPEWFNMQGSNEWFIFDSIKLQYSPNIVLMRWVHPQVIVCWLCILLLYENRKRIEAYVFMLLPGIIFGSFSFIGMLPIAMVSAIVVFVRDIKEWKQYLKNLFSLSNVLLAAILGSVFLSYYWGNVVSEKPEYLGLSVVDYGDRFGIYIIFVLVMVIVPGLCLATAFRKDEMLWAAIALLTILPLFSMGMFNDLVMRASIPGLFIFMIYALSYMDKYMFSEAGAHTVVRNIITAVLALLLLNGIGNSFSDIQPSFVNENYKELAPEYNYGTMEDKANRMNPDIRDDEKYNYFAYDIEDNFFYKYFARVKLPKE